VTKSRLPKVISVTGCIFFMSLKLKMILIWNTRNLCAKAPTLRANCQRFWPQQWISAYATHRIQRVAHETQIYTSLDTWFPRSSL
jgi:hypothetical protein